MEKITVFSCTNRPNSNTLRVSRIYEKLLNDRDITAQVLDFCNLPHNIAFSETFGHRTESYEKLLQRYVLNISRFVFVVPEYNGSFPGILKTFLDSAHPSDWANKRVCLVGVADGRAGNIRGMEHLTSIMNYLKMHVFHNKLPISGVRSVLDDEGIFTKTQMNACISQVEEFLEF